jgi:outer membrane protein assembly factor BamB
MGPVLLPGGLVFADGKSGTGFLLNADKLGGVDGQIHRTTICHGYGGAATLGTTIFVPCTDGVRQVIVEGGNHLRLGWQAPAQVNGSPVIGGHTVYSLDPGGTLYALNSDTGAVTAKVQIDATSRFATPTLATGQVFVGTLTGVVAITIS